MKAFISSLTAIILFAFTEPALGQRQTYSLNPDWQFRFSHQVHRNTEQRVDLPHTWNAQDALSGKIDYKRGIGNYTKKIFIPEAWKQKRLFIRFEGANSIANLFVNGKHRGEHRGGYGAFIFELTNHVRYGEENSLLVRVNNAEQLDVMPLVGDFNFYGGIYRDVEFIITDNVCISPLDYASPGLYLTQQDVNEKQAKVQATVMLSNVYTIPQERAIRLQIKENGKIIDEYERKVTVQAQQHNQPVSFTFKIDNPHLWNGTQDPFMYQVTASVWEKKQQTDCVTQPLGLRYYSVDADKGFFLNGKHLNLHGVCKHQDRAERGNALHPCHHEEDVSLMREMGVNAVRLAHYPHSTYLYSLLDHHGIIAWAEIPFVGPGGYADKGFVDIPAFRHNGKEQLKELIRQHYNHPSICFWGLFNELKEEGDNPVEYIKELHELAHREDPTRPTTAASNQEGDMNFITDVIAWNRYDGWYGATPASLATWLDKTHRENPQLKIAISEYGAGASLYHQQDSLRQSTPKSWWHPENWQTYYHMQNWRIISKRPYVWGSFVWNMFDFGAAHRMEGDRPGINDKGLVTYDRRTRKDAFFFYKANWNPEPMLHICGKRNNRRTKKETEVWIFANGKEVTLYVNDEKPQTVKTDEWNTATFNISLMPGVNRLKAQTYINGKMLEDECVWTLE